ncbi:MAG: hypothetical protein EHM17_10235 [Verrucomicrobiaceae bacterium]|nr:MAG: hypothetical protein EHM17_10235 [Verrucomicrobiaceae bacterium]
MISLGSLERRWGWVSFPGFLRYYALMHALVYVLQMFRPDIGAVLEFDRGRILSGEIWRVVTFLFSSSGFAGVGVMGMLFIFFMVMIAFMMSDALEGAWGVFKTSLFYYCGIFGLIVANFFFPNAMAGSGFLIYGTSFLAFATLFPRVEFLMFFILPVQVRFLAMIQAGVMLLGVFGNWLLLPFFVLGCANYLLFAGIPALRGTAQVLESAQRRKRFRAAKEPDEPAFHTCASCDRTDVTDPQLEFRVGKDGREYCVEHLPE